MTSKRVKAAAGMLPDAAPLILMEAQSPKHICQDRLASGRNVQPNPFADNLVFREVGSWHFACPSAFVKMKRAHPLWNAPA